MTTLHVNHWGEGGGNAAPVVALHGFTGSGLDFECFGESGRRWYAPDLIGHGKTEVFSDVEDYTIEAHIGYLDEVAREVGEPFELLGYSMGGRLALRYVLERPENVKRLVLVGVTPGIEDDLARKERRESDELLAEGILKEGVDVFIKKWQERGIIKTQEGIVSGIREKMMARRLSNSEMGLANSLRGMGTGVMEPMWERLGEVKCPVRLVTGEMDSKFTGIAKAMKERMPHAEHEVVEGVGHAAIWERDGLEFVLKHIRIISIVE